MTDASRTDCAALLAHADWVRSLARQLVRDAHAAEDLAQDTLAAALVRPPPLDRPLRGWLAAVLRNLVREERRDSSHRGARERAAARAESDSSSEELLLRLDSHRALVEAVARLDEPYRTVVLMRWFEGLAPAAIATRTGTPLRTVETRLHRALARLRADLDRAHGGDRRAWLLALIPYARGSSGWSAAALGAFVMDAKLKIGVAALAAVGVCSTLVLWRNARSEAAPPLAPATRPSELEAAQRVEALEEQAGIPAVAERRELESPSRKMRPEPAPAPGPRLTGRVIDVEHAPVAGIRVRFVASGAEAGDGEAVSDASGAFELERPAGDGTLDVASPGWTILFRPAFTAASAAREVVLVVAPSLTLGGRVVDESGRAVEAARVAVPLPFRLRARFDAILDEATSVERETRTDADGRFELAAAPHLSGVELVTSHAGFLEDRRALPAYDELELVLVLRRAEADPGHLLGRVVDPAGVPVADAWVGLGEDSVKSGSRGEFALGIAPERRGAPGTLRAVKRGYLPAELALAPEPWPAEVVLALGPEPLAIQGRVVDARGEPVPGAEVWTDEETHFGYVPLEGGEMSVRTGASIEGLLRGDPWTFRVRADRAGRFQLTGLLPRDYRLRAFDRAHLALATDSVAAGERDVELVLPDEPRHAVVAGVVTDLGGEPLAGVLVRLERPALGGGPGGLLEGLDAKTDAAGRFRFEDVSQALRALRVSGSELPLSGFPRSIAPGDDVAHLELAVPLRVHVRIEAGPEADFDHVALLDERGERLTLSVNHGEHSFLLEEMDLDHGRSEAFSVSELATTLVLLAQGVELRRVPVALVRGELNTIRP